MLVDIPVGASPAGGSCSVATVVMLDNGRGTDPLKAVKNKRALKQSIASVKFLAFAIAVMLVHAVKYPSGCTIVPLGIFAIFLFIDAITIREELTRRGVVTGRRNGCFPPDVHTFCTRFRVTKKDMEHQMNCALEQISTGTSACSRSDQKLGAPRRDRSCRVF